MLVFQIVFLERYSFKDQNVNFFLNLVPLWIIWAGTKANRVLGSLLYNMQNVISFKKHTYCNFMGLRVTLNALQLSFLSFFLFFSIFFSLLFLHGLSKIFLLFFYYSLPTKRGSKIIIVSLHTLKKARVKIFPLLDSALVNPLQWL